MSGQPEPVVVLALCAIDMQWGTAIHCQVQYSNKFDSTVAPPCWDSWPPVAIILYSHTYQVHTRCATSAGWSEQMRPMATAERTVSPWKSLSCTFLYSRDQPWKLKELIDEESITCYCRQFHLLTTLSEKNWRLKSRRHRLFNIMALWPFVPVLIFNVNRLSNFIFDHRLYILQTSRRSAMFCRSSKVHNPNSSSLLS